MWNLYHFNRQPILMHIQFIQMRVHPPSTAGYLLLLNANVLIIKTPPAAHMIPHFYDSTVSFVNIRHLACAPSTPKLFNSDGFLAPEGRKRQRDIS